MDVNMSRGSLSKGAVSQSLQISASAAGRFALSGFQQKAMHAKSGTPFENCPLPSNERYSSSPIQVVRCPPSAATNPYSCYPSYRVTPNKIVEAISVPPIHLPLNGAFVQELPAPERPQFNPMDRTPLVPLRRLSSVQRQQSIHNMQPVVAATPNCIQPSPPLMPYCYYTTTECGQVGQQLMPISTAVIKYSPAIGGAPVVTHNISQWYGLEVPDGQMQPLMPLDMRLLGGNQIGVQSPLPPQYLDHRQQLIDSVQRLSLVQNVSSSTGNGQPSLPFVIGSSTNSTTAPVANVTSLGGTDCNGFDPGHVMGDEGRVMSTALSTVGVRWKPVTATDGDGPLNYVSEWCPLIHPSEYVHRPLSTYSLEVYIFI